MIEILVIGLVAVVGLFVLAALALKLAIGLVKLPFLLLGGLLKLLALALGLALKVILGIGAFVVALMALLLLPLLPFVIVGLAIWLFARLFFSAPRGTVPEQHRA
jgi:hypothetical protein